MNVLPAMSYQHYLTGAPPLASKSLHKLAEIHVCRYAQAPDQKKKKQVVLARKVSRPGDEMHRIAN